MNKNSPLNNRSEKKGNLVPIIAYDNTSRGTPRIRVNDRKPALVAIYP